MNKRLAGLVCKLLGHTGDETPIDSGSSVYTWAYRVCKRCGFDETFPTSGPDVASHYDRLTWWTPTSAPCRGRSRS